MVKYIFIIVLSVVLSYCLRGYAVNIDYDDYDDVLNSLMNVSSIVFAIIGAWVAIVYPQALNRLVSSGTEESGRESSVSGAEEDANYLSDLIEIVLVSSFVLLCVLSIMVAVPILSEVFSSSVKSLLRVVGFGIVIFLSFLQIFSIARVVLANYYFLRELRDKIKSKKIDGIFTGVFRRK